MWEEGPGPGASKTRPTCSIMAWARGWAEEREEAAAAAEEGSPTPEAEEEAAEGAEEGERRPSPQVRH